MKMNLFASHAAIVALLLAGTSCNDDWGQADPPAGNQIYPTLQKAGEINFDDETALDPDNYIVTESTAGTAPEIVQDAIAKSPVLQLNQGTVSFANPLNQLKCQKAASFTFWMHQPMEKDEEGNPVGTQDINSPIITFINEAVVTEPAATSRVEAQPYDVYGTLSFTANGKIDYNTTAGTFVANDPAESLTGYIPGGDWHYVAVTIHDKGYTIAVDGEKKAEVTVEDFDTMSIVEFMNNASTVQLGSLQSTQQLLIDDVNIYRNALTDKETKRPKKGNIGKDPGANDDEFEYPIATKSEIGLPDCTTPWWSEFSDYYSFPGNTALHLAFTNHTSGGGNWNNWNLCVSTNAERGADGYLEYFVIRSDLYGWGSSYGDGKWSNTGYPTNDSEWADFRTNMEGAYVTIDLVRAGDKVTVTAKATTENGTVYIEEFTAPAGDEDDTLNAFLIVDGSYLEMDKANTYYYTPVPLTKKEIGLPDCTTPWWSEFSEYFEIEANKNLELTFINHTSGGGNWNNWNLCVSTNAERGADGYLEYFVIRSDLYGWGDSYASGTWSNEGYPTNDSEWGDFRTNMEGATVVMNITRNGETSTVTALQTCPNGTIYKEVFSAPTGDEDETINAFLITDGSYLEMKSAQFTVAAFK